MVKKILINFPTNLGDSIISLPVLDRLKSNYPKAKITAIVSPKAKDFLLKNNFIDELIVFNKLWSWSEKITFALDLRGKYDLMADLKNSCLALVLGVKYRTPFIRRRSKSTHIVDEYLNLVKAIAPRKRTLKSKLSLSDAAKEKIEKLGLKKSIFIACSSREQLKQYPYEYLKLVVEKLCRRHSVVILGLAQDRSFYKDILSLDHVIDLVGKTEMDEVYFLLKKYARLVLAVDSSIMHLSSYLNLPIVALFGSSNSQRYQPWSRNSLILKKELEPGFLPRENPTYQDLLEYMKIDPKRVLKAVEDMLSK